MNTKDELIFLLQLLISILIIGGLVWAFFRITGIPL
jgi:hypothetical protein